MDDLLRCDVCGHFISYQSIDSGAARRQLITPDSDFTTETLETLCSKHVVRGVEHGARA